MTNFKKIQVKKCFVLSAIKIIKTLGFGKLNARNIAKDAGYKPGSIYNYFDNLNHLENVTSIHFTRDYVNALANKTKEAGSGIRSYLMMWELFLLYGFREPVIFYNVFYSSINKDKECNLFEEYYEIFPDELPTGGYIEGMFHIKTAQKRGYYVLEKCLEEGSIDQNMINYINDLNIGYTNTIFYNMAISELYVPSPELFHQTMVYLIYSIYYYINLPYREELDNILEFHLKQSKKDNYSLYY